MATGFLNPRRGGAGRAGLAFPSSLLDPLPRRAFRPPGRRRYGPGSVKGLDVRDGMVMDGTFGLVTSADCDATVPKWVGVPASASATGTAGEMAYDSSYLYLCVATDTWRRIAHSTF